MPERGRKALLRDVGDTDRRCLYYRYCRHAARAFLLSSTVFEENYALDTIAPVALWATFLVFVAFMLALDLGVFRRRSHRISFSEAAIWSAVWVGLAVAFNAGIYVYFGQTAALEFATGYVIEKALAVDNIFVFAMIFAGLGIPVIYQHRILVWGVVGAIVLRAIMIGLGSAVFHSFHWAAYFFGVLLIFTGLKFLLQKEDGDPSAGLVKWVGKFVPLSNRIEGNRFFVLRDGRRLATPLFLALVAVELSDVIFAVDSIPAIFAVTRDPFIVFTSNIFAILGLRSMYFLLANLLDDFAYLKHGLATVLMFVGTKMLLVDVVTIPVGASLGFIAVILGTAVLTSIVVNPVDPLSRDYSKESSGG